MMIRYHGFGETEGTESASGKVSRYAFRATDSSRADEELGLMYYDQRWHDSRTGSFLSNEPIADDDMVNYAPMGDA